MPESDSNEDNSIQVTLNLNLSALKKVSQFNGIVRNLRIEDFEQLEPIYRHWVVFDQDPNQKEIQFGRKNAALIDTLSIEKYFKDMKETLAGKHPEKVFLIAETIDGQVIGIMGAKSPGSYLLPFAKTEKPAEIINAYVVEEFRRQGTGTAIYQHMEKILIKRGFKESILKSRVVFYKTAYDFYRARGFEIRGQILNPPATIFGKQF